MKLNEIAAEPVYLRVSGSHRAGGLNSGKYRVRSMERRDDGFDVGIKSWTDGFIFVPDRTTKELMFVAKNGQPLTPMQAAQRIQ